MSKPRVEYALFCSYCNNQFQAGRLDAEYCSDRCRKAYAREAEQLDILTATEPVPPGEYALLLGPGTLSRFQHAVSQVAVTPTRSRVTERKLKSFPPYGIDRDRWDEIADGRGIVRLTRREVRLVEWVYPGALQRALGIGRSREDDLLAGSDYRIEPNEVPLPAD